MKRWILRLREWGVWLCVLWELLLFLDIPVLNNLVYLMPYAQAVLAALSLAADPPRGRGRWVLCAGFLWLCLITVFRGFNQVSLARYALGNAAFAYFVCEAAGRAEGRALLRRVAVTVVAVTAVYACAGIFGALGGKRVYTFDASHYAGLRKGRLYLFRYPTVAGNLLTLAIMAAVWLIAGSKRLTAQLLLGAAACLDAVCLGLTDTRASFVALGAALGLLLAERVRRMPKLPLPRALAAGLAFALPLLGVYGALSLMPGLYSSLGIPSGGKLYLNDLLPLASSAGAEGAAATVQAAHRGIDAGAFLSGRPAVWQAAFELLRQQPAALLTGITTVHPMDAIQPLVTGSSIQYNHVHSIFLQALVETGAPGLTLMAVYLWDFAKAGYLLLRSPRSTAADRAMAALPFSLLLMDTVECHLLLELQNPSLMVLFLFMGAVIARAGALEAEERKEKAEQTKADA